MRHRLLIVVLLLALLVPLNGVLAQEGEVFCGDLSAEDCTLLEESQAAMMTLESLGFNFDANMEMSASGGDMGMEGIALNLAGEGALAMDIAALADLQAMQPDDMANMGEMMSQLLNSVNAEMVLQLGLPEDMVGPKMSELSLDMRMVDGVFYVEISKLMQAPEETWMGLDMGALYGVMFSEMMGEMDMGEMMGSDIFSLSSDPEFINEFMTISRLDDAEVMGQTVAVFEMTLDYGALMSDEAFREAMTNYMNSIMAMQGMDEEMPPGFDMDLVMDMMMARFVDATLSYTQWLGLDDHYVHHGEMDMAFNMNMAAMMASVPEADTEGAPESFSISFDATYDLHAFNEPVEVTAPENAQIIDPMQFMGPSF